MFKRKELVKRQAPKCNFILPDEETINYMIFGLVVWFAGFLVIGDLFIWG